MKRSLRTVAAAMQAVSSTKAMRTMVRVGAFAAGLVFKAFLLQAPCALVDRVASLRHGDQIADGLQFA